MSTTNYGATTAAQQHDGRDSESQALLNRQSTTHAQEANDTFYGRTFVHVTTHRKRYFALWLLAAVAAISTVVGLHYYHKQKEHRRGPGHHDPEGLMSFNKGGDKFADQLMQSVDAKNSNTLARPERCESDRSYPIAILLSIFFGYVGVDRFYLGYVISALLKLATAGGFGIWYVIDIVLIILGGLPDHNGCHLTAP
ncbi:hypothetical protein EDD11_007380 [Mortierella claussenii]|nr:hypothetical protein EDD11_007380 [Mortierella claussenii]